MDGLILDLFILIDLKKIHGLVASRSIPKFFLEHGKQITFEKIVMCSALKISLMAFILCLKVQLAWVMSM